MVSINLGPGEDGPKARRGVMSKHARMFLAALALVIGGMAGDGSDVRQISFFDTGERSPGVDNEGRLIYGRWDYIRITIRLTSSGRRVLGRTVDEPVSPE
jgi:hypothetical protein